MLKLELTNMQVANEKYVSDVKIGQIIRNSIVTN